MWYSAQAIVYTMPGSLAEWKLLVDSDGCDSPQEALESLYFRVQEQTGEITGWWEYILWLRNLLIILSRHRGR
jgi:hypothetical protein